VRLPFGALVHGSEIARRLHLLDFGADRAVLLNGPMALDPTRAASEWGWKARQGSAEVLHQFLAA
jgi:hypothetical protein